MKKNLFHIACLVLAMFAMHATAANAQNAENEQPHAVIVEWEVEEINVEKFVNLLTQLQTATLENESGCITYEILQNKAKPSQFFIYEVFENAAAYDAHIRSAHFKTLVSSQIKPLIKQEKITHTTPLNMELLDDNEENTDY